MTRAAILHAIEQPLVIEEIDVAPPQHGEVLVRMTASGVCHSDLHSITGTFPWPMPSILGHEGAGIVEAIGPGVDNVAPGDHVLLTWLPYCGSCRQCTRGRPNICEGLAWVDTGTMMDGTTRFSNQRGPIYHYTGSTFTERSVVPAQTCIRIEPDLDPAEICLFGCAVMTGVGAVLNSANVQPGESVAVVGCGGVGLNVIQGARIAGAGRIVAIDRVPAKLEVARALGATEVIDAGSADPRVVLADGVDYVFEAIGRPDTIDLAIDLTAPGGQVVLVGMAPVGTSTTVEPLTMTMTDRIVRGSWYGGTVPERDFPLLIDLYRRGELRLDAMVERIGLDDINAAFDAIRTGDAVRRVIVFD